MKTTNILDGISRKDLMQTFSEIDERIASLHNCSAEDFTKLNDCLKRHHKLSSVIFENSRTIHEILGGDRAQILKVELEKIVKELRSSRQRLNERNIHDIRVLEKLLVKSIHLSVCVKHCKQDLGVYKFLVFNKNILTNPECLQDKDKEVLLQWDRFIQDYEAEIPEMDKALEDIKEFLYGMIARLKDLGEKTGADFRELVQEQEESLSLVSRKNRETADSLPRMKMITENAARNIGHIITHLQYHDIIWQKMEHIKQAHTRIMGEDAFQVEKLGDVSDLQAAQLMLVSKEYQGAIEVIVNSFQQVGMDVDSITRLTREISLDEKSADESMLKQVKTGLDRAVELLDGHNYEGLFADIKKMKNKLYGFQRRLEGLVSQACSMSMADTARDSFPGPIKIGCVSDQFGGQLFTLLEEMVKKLLNADTTMKEMISQVEVLGMEEASEEWSNEMDRDRIGLMVGVSRILDGLDGGHDELVDLLNQNQELSDEILGDVKGSIRQIAYYDFFEKVIEDIILKLKGLSGKIVEGLSEDERRRINLEEIRDLYTIKSERLVYDRVEKGENSDDFTDLMNKEEDGDDLELF